MDNLPTGTVTFLFTDIQGSTKLAQDHPDDMPALLARHNEILKQAIERYNGFVFQIVGDSFAASFHNAGDALHAAVESQRLLAQEAWSPAPIRVRMGIHTGQADIQANGDYRGYLTLSHVQRLMSAAHGGQVLLSFAAQELVQEALPEGVTLRDMGEHRLKDIPRTEHIYQLVIPELPTEFAPLKTLDVIHHNLPAQMTSFIGREKEREEIKQTLSTHRLVTLTGSGGAGKSRLSLQVGMECLHDFSDGVWLIELAPVTDSALVPQALLSTFNLREDRHRSVLDVLVDYLHARAILLILDNCEHLIEACAQISTSLLQACPKLRILASSREALGIAGEVTYRVPSLGLPDVACLPSIESLSQYEAVKLFIERDHEQSVAGSRPSAWASIKAGADEDGNVVAWISDSWGSGGLPGTGTTPIPYVFEPPNRRHVHTSVPTNFAGSRAWRAPNHPQAAYLTMSVMEDLAAELKMDPLDFLRKNLPIATGKRQAVYEEELKIAADPID